MLQKARRKLVDISRRKFTNISSKYQRNISTHLLTEVSPKRRQTFATRNVAANVRKHFLFNIIKNIVELSIWNIDSISGKRLEPSQKFRNEMSTTNNVVVCVAFCKARFSDELSTSKHRFFSYFLTSIRNGISMASSICFSDFVAFQKNTDVFSTTRLRDSLEIVVRSMQKHRQTFKHNRTSVRLVWRQFSLEIWKQNRSGTSPIKFPRHPSNI